MAGGPSAASTQRIGPPHRGHVSRSARKTWASSHAQRLRAGGAGVVVVATERGKRELVARRGGRSALGGIARRFWDDFTAQSGVTRQDLEIPAPSRPACTFQERADLGPVGL